MNGQQNKHINTIEYQSAVKKKRKGKKNHELFKFMDGTNIGHFE